MPEIMRYNLYRAILFFNVGINENQNSAKFRLPTQTFAEFTQIHILCHIDCTFYIDFISRGNSIVSLLYGPQTITVATKHTRRVTQDLECWPKTSISTVWLYSSWYEKESEVSKFQ